MKFISTYVASAVLMLGAGQALAMTNQPVAASSSTAPATLAPPPTPSRLDPNQVVCKREETTGTRLGAGKVCMTRQEWADRAAASRTAVDKIQQRGITLPR